MPGCLLSGMVNRQTALRFALRSDGSVKLGIVGADIVVRRAGWLAGHH